MGSIVKLTTDQLLHPEMLRPDTIRQILISRGMSKELILKADSSELLNFYNKLVLPLPQRVKKTSSHSDSEELPNSTKSQCQNGNLSKSSHKHVRIEFPPKERQHSNKSSLSYSSNITNDSNQRLNLKKKIGRSSSSDDDPENKKIRREIKWP